MPDPHATPRTVLTGHYNTVNFGDILIAELMAREVRAMTGAPPLCPWVHPDVANLVCFAAGSGWSDCRGDAAIFGGGGYLNDGIMGGGSRRLLKYALTSRLFRLTRTPYCVAGVGAGPTCSSKGAKRIRSVLMGAERVGVRDDESVDFLANTCGVPRERMTRTADLALAMTRADVPQRASDDIERMLGPGREGATRLCVHLQMLPEFREHIPGLVRAIAEGLEGSDVEPFFLFDGGRGGYDVIEAARDEHFPGARLLPDLDYWQVAAAIASADAIITTKLHVGIVGWAFNVPACGVSFHGKTKRFYKQIGRSDFQVDLGPDSHHDARRWVETLVQDPEGFAVESAEARVELPRLARVNYEIVRKTFEGAGVPLAPGAQAAG
ncbi:MAG: polysaccharide pyruvyl transferase family protein [Planctomycetota bacterium]